MNEILIGSKRFVISRRRDDNVFELVGEDGEVVIKHGSDLFGCPVTTKHEPVVPGITPFSLRPRSFLTELRTRRDVDLGKRVRVKRAEKAAGQVPRPRTKRTSLKSQAETAAASLPFDLMSLLKGKQDVTRESKPK
jgi:hypothetical protein